MSEEQEHEEENEEENELELDSVSSDEEKESATKQGWTDRDEWRGDPEKWVSAQEFLERGERYVPILKERFANLESKYDEQAETFKKFVKFQEEKEERIRKEAYEQALQDAEERQRKAFNDGDEDAFNKARADEAKIREERVKPQESPERPAEHPDFKGWVNDNSWYTDSRAARALADEIGRELGQTSNLNGRAFFDAVKAEVQKEMPQLFENPNRRRAASVEGANNGGGGKRNGKTYSDLPAEAKRACDDFCATIPNYTKEKYLKDYDWSQNVQ